MSITLSSIVSTLLFGVSLVASASVASQNGACDSELQKISVCLEKYDLKYENCGSADANCKCLILDDAINHCVANSSCESKESLRYLDMYDSNSCITQNPDVEISAVVRFEGDSEYQHRDDMFIPPSPSDDGASYDFNTGESDIDRSFYDGFFNPSSRARNYWTKQQAPSYSFRNGYAPVFGQLPPANEQQQTHGGMFGDLQETPGQNPSNGVPDVPQFINEKLTQQEPVSRTQPVLPPPDTQQQQQPSNQMNQPAINEKEQGISGPQDQSYYGEFRNNRDNIHSSYGPQSGGPRNDMFAPVAPEQENLPYNGYSYQQPQQPVSEPNWAEEETPQQQPSYGWPPASSKESRESDYIFESPQVPGNNLYKEPSPHVPYEEQNVPRPQVQYEEPIVHSPQITYEEPIVHSPQAPYEEPIVHNSPVTTHLQEIPEGFVESELEAAPVDEESTLSMIPDYSGFSGLKESRENEYLMDYTFNDEELYDSGYDSDEETYDYSDESFSDVEQDDFIPHSRSSASHPANQNNRPAPHWPPATRKYRYDELGNVDDPHMEDQPADLGYFDFADYDFEDSPIVLDDEIEDYEELSYPHDLRHHSSSGGSSRGYTGSSNRQDRYYRNNEPIYEELQNEFEEEDDEFDPYPVEIEDEESNIELEEEYDDGSRRGGLMKRLRDTFGWFGSVSSAGQVDMIDPLENMEGSPEQSDFEYEYPQPVPDVSSPRSTFYPESVEIGNRAPEVVAAQLPMESTATNATVTVPTPTAHEPVESPEPTMRKEEREAKEREREEILKAKARLSAQRKDKARKAEEAQRQAFRGMEHEGREHRSASDSPSSTTYDKLPTQNKNDMGLDKIEAESAALILCSNIPVVLGSALALVVIFGGS